MRCCVPYCKNDSRNMSKSQGITFHAFPNESSLRTAWLKALAREDWEPKERSSICSEHFLCEDLYDTKNGLRKVRPGAVPLILQGSVNMCDYEESAPLKVCRICLAMDSKLFPITITKLEKAYEHLTGISVQAEDRLPQKLCVECAQRLLSCSRFRYRTLRANFLMMELVKKQNRLTIHNIQTINPENNHLNSPLSLKHFNADYYDRYFIEDLEKLPVFEEKEEYPNATPPENVDVEIKQENDIFVTEETVKQENETVEELDRNEDNDSTVDSDRTFFVASDQNYSSDDSLPLQKCKAKKLKKKKEVNLKKPMKRVKKAKEPAEPKIDRRRKPFLNDDLNETLFAITDLSFEEQIAEILKRQDSSNYKNAIFKCMECYKGFLDEDAYNGHIIRHTNQSGEHECEICKTHFKHPHALRKHITAHHTQRFSCKQCNYVTTHRQTARLHERWHNGTKYSCPHCQHEFLKFTTYMGHIRIKHPSDFVCELCGYSFVSAKGIELHKKLKHRLDNAQIPEDGPFCEMCNVKFVSAEAHKRHLSVSARHNTGKDKESQMRNHPKKVKKSKESKEIERRSTERDSEADEKKKIYPSQMRKAEGPIPCEQTSETAVGGISRTTSTALSRKESYKAQRQHYRREKKRAASALLHSIEDPSVVVLADWLKVRGSLKSWTKLWCVLKPGLLLLYKSSKAKSSHWVGTVLLTSCQVIERPSKKDGFCFKLYHPLEQSIWAPRGPHNETIGAVVQPLPTAHLIFRASSQAAGHCWLDGLELALRCSNAMLRCSRSKPEQTVTPDAPQTQMNLSHEDLEKHFNEHELAGAASDSDSEASRPGMPEPQPDKKQDILARLARNYILDTNTDIGQAGELVEEVAEENKSLLWFLLKQVRPGMDLSKVVLPTFILEPRSFLDKLSDNYYHADILAQASLQEDPYQRFKTVLRWYLSGLYRKPKGLKKPYNPVLGECFRCCWKHDSQSYTYYVAEQVSHHPPVSAFYVSNRQEGFVIEGSLLARSKFYGNSTSAILEGCARIHLLNWGEQYITSAPYAHCKGIVIGTLSMELGGKVHIMCPDTGYHADVEFKLRSFLSSADQTNAISGRIKRGKDTIATIDGYWDGKVDIKDKKTGEDSNLMDVTLLKDQRLPRYLLSLDNQLEYESQKLWIRVSEAIANDDQIAATEQKTIIEEAQRARARNMVAPWVPRFFHKDLQASAPEGMVDQGWKYNHINASPWQGDEVIEFEEDFVIKSLMESPVSGRPSIETRREISRPSDSDSHDDLARRSKASTRTLKQSLYAIDSALRDQTIAIERLSKTVEAISEGQRTATTSRHHNIGRMPNTSHSWDLFGGFVLAMVLQALLNWIFYQKD